MIKTLFLLLIIVFNLTGGACVPLRFPKPNKIIWRQLRSKAREYFENPPPPPTHPVPPTPPLAQTPQNCTYRFDIKTNCSSPAYTRDRIGIAFGDNDDNLYYTLELSNLSKFEPCSNRSFYFYVPCLRLQMLCSLYLYRSGGDGWMPESVTFSGDNIETEEFDYNIFLPNETWYGYDCSTSAYSPAYSPADSFPPGSSTDSLQHSSWKWFEYVMLGLIVSAFM